MPEHFEVTAEDGNRRTVRFRQSADEVSRLFGKVRRDISKDMVMPGFRPGRIPAGIIDQRYGNLITAEVADMIRQELTSELLSSEDWILDDSNPSGEADLPVDGEGFAPDHFASVQCFLRHFQNGDVMRGLLLNKQQEKRPRLLVQAAGDGVPIETRLHVIRKRGGRIPQ